MEILEKELKWCIYTVER